MPQPLDGASRCSHFTLVAELAVFFNNFYKFVKVDFSRELTACSEVPTPFPASHLEKKKDPTQEMRPFFLSVSLACTLFRSVNYQLALSSVTQEEHRGGGASWELKASSISELSSSNTKQQEQQRQQQQQQQQQEVGWRWEGERSL